MAATNCQVAFHQATRKREKYPRPICASTLVKSQLVCLDQLEARKTPSSVSAKARQRAWKDILVRPWPFAWRAAIEKGIDAPTMNMKQGWMRSQSVQPVQG